MSQEQLESVVENLETFVQLKMQNLLIYSWIQIKKHSKSTTPGLHIRNKSHSDTFNSFPYEKTSYHHLVGLGAIKPPTLIAQDLNLIQTERYSNQFEAVNRNDELFQTFNQFGKINKFSIQESDTYQYQPSNKIKFQTNYYEDAQEADQFEDIVLDRLSKLQENISKLMAEKKTKEEWRGYVGNALDYKQFKTNYDQNAKVLDEEPFPQQDEEKINRKVKQDYEQWQASPVKGKADVIYNLKYIPMIKKDSVDIFKIRELIDTSHREGQNQCLDNFAGLNAGNNKFKYRADSKNRNLTGRNSDKKSGLPSRQKGSSTLYFNRYDGNRSIKNGDQVHFAPKNIEMQTVIQPRSKYSRNNSNKNINNRNRENNTKMQRKDVLNGKASGVSNSSQNSYFSSRSEVANNRSALY